MDLEIPKIRSVFDPLYEEQEETEEQSFGLTYDPVLSFYDQVRTRQYMDAEINPDDRYGAIDIHNQFIGSGIEAPLVTEIEQDAPRFESRLEAVNLEKTLDIKNKPVTLRLLTDPQIGVLYAQDMESLSEHEGFFQNIYNQWVVGGTIFEQAELSRRLWLGQGTYEDEWRLQQLENASRVAAERLDEEKGAVGWIKSIPAVGASMLPYVLGTFKSAADEMAFFGAAGAGAGFLFGGPLLAVPMGVAGTSFGVAAGMLKKTAEVEAALAWREMGSHRDPYGVPLDPEVRTGLAWTVGYGTAALEGLVGAGIAKVQAPILRQFMRKGAVKWLAVPSVAKMAKAVSYKLAGDAAVNGLEESTQELLSIVADAHIREMLLEPEVETIEYLKQIAQAGSLGVRGGFGLKSIETAPYVSIQMYNLNQSAGNIKIINKMGGLFNSSGLAEKYPEYYDSAVSDMSKSVNHTGFIGVNGEELDIFFQEGIESGEFTQEQLSKEMPDVVAAMEAAKEKGGDVLIKNEAFAKFFAASDRFLQSRVADHVRLRPGDSTKFESTQARKAFQDLIDRNKVEIAASQDIYKKFRNVTAKVFSSDEADFHAQAMTAFFVTVGKKAGLTVEETMGKFGLDIVRQEAEQLDIEQAIELIQKGTVPTEGEAMGKSLQEFVQERMGEPNVREQAVSAGYFEGKDPTDEDFDSAVSSETPIYAYGGGNAELMSARERISQVEDQAKFAGVDLHEGTPEEVARKLSEGSLLQQAEAQPIVITPEESAALVDKVAHSLGIPSIQTKITNDGDGIIVDTSGLDGEEIDAIVRVAALQGLSVETPEGIDPDSGKRVSTRYPKSVNRPRDPVKEQLDVDLESAASTPKQFAKNIKLVKTYTGFKTRKRRPDAIAEEYIEQTKDNLLWMFNKIPEEIRNRSRLWYDGARRIAHEWAHTYGIRPEVAAGIIAALSPQKDWDINASLAERVVDILTHVPDSARIPRATRSHAINVFRDFTGKISTKNKKLVDSILGKTIGSLTDYDQIAAWVRIYDETYNDRSYRTLTPEGVFIGDPSGTVPWGSVAEIAKAVKIYKSKTIQDISRALGFGHKVRNFYNNIIAPNNGIDVTIDSHAVAALLLRPLSASTFEAGHNFGQTKGSSASTLTGVSGSYPLNAEAYRRAAEAVGMRPRELQSIIWEAEAGLFSREYKKQVTKSGIDVVDQIWKKYEAGKITIDEAREEVFNEAGGIDAPGWNRPDSLRIKTGWNSSYEGKLSGPSLPREPTRRVGSGARSGVAGGAAELGLDKWAGVITWESLPSESLGLEIFNASDQAQDLFTDESRAILISDDGRDMLAEALGIENAAIRSGAGAFAGNITPNNLSHIDSKKSSGEFDQEMASLYAQAIQYIFKQDAVPWFRPVPDDSPKYARGIKITFNEELSRQSLKDVLSLLTTVLGDDAGFTKTGPTEITIINFRDDETNLPFVDDDVFIKNVFRFVDKNIESLGIKDNSLIYSEGKYGTTHSWKSDPEGKELYSNGGWAGRPDLHQRIHGWRVDFEKLLQRYEGEELKAREAEASRTRFYQGGKERDGETGGEGGARTNDAGLPVREDGSVGLFHYSGVPGLKSLSPEKHGTGIAGAESKRKDSDPANWVGRTYWGVESGGYEKESGLGSNQYSASVMEWDLYDFAGDPEGLRSQAKAARLKDPWGDPLNIYERLIKEAGHKGYFTATSSGVVAVTFEEMAVDENTDGSANAFGRFEQSWPLRPAELMPGEYPDTLADVHRHTTVSKLTSHAGFKSAKLGGDTGAAAEVAESAIKGKVVDGIAANIPRGKRVAIVPVLQKESSTNLNVIPLAYAEVLEDALAERGFEVYIHRDILKRQGGALTGAGATDRAAMQHDFVGSAPSRGEHVIVVDDTFTSGSTIKGLVDYITKNGGVVDQASTLASGRYQNWLRPSKEKIQKLLDKVGVDTIGFENEIGYPPESLTGSQIQQYILNGAKGVRGFLLRFPPKASAGGPGGAAPFTQKEKKVTRGFINISPARDFFKITLTGDANLSTFLHEFGHMALEVYSTLVSTPDASKAMIDDFFVINKWLGVTSDQKNYTREQHERFARGFESYLMEGKAPTLELQGIFRTFAAWLKRIYTSNTALNVKLTDDVRDVMDRMFASDEMIKATKQVQDIAPLFSSPEHADMTPGEYKKYVDGFSDAMETAEETMRARVMTAITRRFTREYKEAKKKIKADITGEVSRRPVYRAWSYFKKGIIPPDDLIINPSALGKLDRASVKALFHDDPNILNKLKGVTRKKNGADPDLVARAFGFGMAHEMLSTMIDSPPMAETIKIETESQLAAIYGDEMKQNKEMEASANSALHNDRYSDFIARELRDLSKRSNNPLPPNFTRSMQLNADEAVAGMTVTELQSSHGFLMAEQRAAKQALTAAAKNDWSGAAVAKQKQIMNHWLYRKAIKAKEEIDKTHRYIKTFEATRKQQRLGKAGGNYLEAAMAMTEGIILRKESGPQIRRRKSLEQYLQGIENEDGQILQIDPRVRADLGKKNFGEMLLQETRALRDALKNIDHLSRLKNKLLTKRWKMSFQAAVERLSSSIRENVKAIKRSQRIDKNLWERMTGKIREFDSALLKPEFLIEWLDGGIETGIAHEFLFQDLADSQKHEFDRLKGLTESLMKPLREMTKNNRTRYSKYFNILPGIKLRGHQIIALALNVGNASNMDKLVRGYEDLGWTEEMVMEAVDEWMDNSDWNLVEHIWKEIGQFWPEIAALNKKYTGLEPPKIEGRDFKTKTGRTIKGAYYPVVYDPTQNYRTHQLNNNKTNDMFESNLMRPNVSAGFVEGRTTVARPMLLDLSGMSNHFIEVLHYVTHYEAITETYRILNDKEVRSAMVETVGQEHYDKLVHWLRHIANSGKVSQETHVYDSFARRMAIGTSIVSMSGSLSTALIQPLGLLSAVPKIGYKGIMYGFYRIFQPEAWKQMNANSKEMPHLVTTFDRDARSLAVNMMHSIQKSPSDSLKHYSAKTVEFGFMVIGRMQQLVSGTVYQGAYRKAIVEEGMTPGQASNYADSVVRKSQSSGGLKDLASIQRGHPVWRLFTAFYGYFSAMYGLLRETGRKSKTKPLGAIADITALLILPVIIERLMRDGLPDDETPEELAEELGIDVLLFASSTIPLFRDIANGMLGGYGYSVAPVAQIAKNFVYSGKKVFSDKELTARDWKNLATGFSAYLHLPIKQPVKWWEYWQAYTGGEIEEPFREFLFGVKR